MDNDERTEMRLTVWENGYTPLPNVDKLCQLPGWSTVDVDEAAIRSWRRMGAFEATGLRLEDGLMAFDFDANVPAVRDLYDALLDAFPRLGGAIMRQGKGWKEAWFVRVEEPFGRIATATYAEGAGPELDPEGDGLTIECFGGESRRQFGAMGWHTKGELSYEWVEDAGPWNTPLYDLPELTLREVAAVMEFCEHWLAERFEKIRGTLEQTSAEQLWDLTDDMVFDTREVGELTLDELRSMLEGQRGGYFYMSASFIDGPVARNTRRCSATLDREGGVTVWDSMTDHTHHEEALRPRSTAELVASIRERLGDQGIEIPEEPDPEPLRRGQAAEVLGIEDRRYLTADNGNIKPTMGNVHHWLQHRLPGVIMLNDMSHTPWVMEDAGVFMQIDRSGFPRPIADEDILRLVQLINLDLDDEGRLGAVFGKDAVRDGVWLTAREHRWDPLRDMLEALPAWDGVPRMSTWLMDYGGVAPDAAHSERYIRAVSRKWLISCIARAMNPGCKVDTTLVLKGPQGSERRGKSSLLEALAGRFAPGPDGRLFGDDMPPLKGSGDHKASAEWIRGIWIAEDAELSSISKADNEAVKGFKSRTSDRFRVPYQEHPKTVYRRTVFAATTNHREFLTDLTGARRFWPVPAYGRINVAGFEAVVTQVWAEAREAHAAGEPWWFDIDTREADAEAMRDAAVAQAAASKIDPVAAMVAEVLAGWPEPEDRWDRTEWPTLLDIHRKVAKDPGAGIAGMAGAAKHAYVEAINAAGWEKHPKSKPNRSAHYWRTDTAEPYDKSSAPRKGKVVPVDFKK